MPNLTVLIKPASSSCNMRCRYCFYHDVAANRSQANMGILAEETMKPLIQKAIAFVGVGGKLNFAFQGGEPTLCGVEFFQQFISCVNDALRDTRCLVQYALQTNGLLLDQKFCLFLAAEHFLVGVSLDGPAAMHNMYRLDSSGQATFSRVIEAVRCLESCGVDYNILSVITRLQVRQPEKLYTFFQNNGFTHVQLIPCVEDFGAKRQNRFVPDAVAYGKFLCRMFDLWLEGWEQGNPISIREFDNLMELVLFGQEPELCAMRGTCSVHAVVEADGSVYPCDFYVLDQWRLGNLLAADFKDLLTGAQEQIFLQGSMQRAEACTRCKYLKWCRSGCQRLREPLTDGKKLSSYKWCDAQRIFIPHALARMSRLALAVQRQNSNDTQREGLTCI